jgi:hypothetical protein
MDTSFTGESSIEVGTAHGIGSIVPSRSQMYLAMIEHISMFHSRYRWDATRLDSTVSEERGSLDMVEQLRIECPYAFIQLSDKFGFGTGRYYIFKMSEDGPGSGVDLVTRMQPGRDLDKRWIMFDHLNRVRGWTTMSCYVYDSEMCRLMTIATCEILSDEVNSQKLMWLALNNVMERNGVPNPYFKGFVADGDDANWMAVRIVYGNGNPNRKMVGRERYNEVDWTGSLERYAVEHIRPDLREMHKRLCTNFKEAKTPWEAEEFYHCTRDWWLSSGAATEDGLRELDDWLGFWHFRFRQWGGFYELVRVDCLFINMLSYESE